MSSPAKPRALFAAFAAGLLPLLLGCTTRITTEDEFNSIAFGLSRQKATVGTNASRPRHHIGAPYYANGRWNYPRHQPEYSAMGTAIIYGEDYTGRITANGEIYDAQNLFAAHPTLPLPSYVEVRNVRNGRSLTIRVNDRGPFTGHHVIAVSARAAELLGFGEQSAPAAPAHVEVHYLSPAPVRHIGRNH